MKQRSCYFFFTLFITSASFAQILIPDYNQKSDSTNRFTISLNPIQIPIDELGIYLDYSFNKKHSFGINVAHIYPNIFLKYATFNQNTYPGTVYRGTAIRFNYKNYFTYSRHQYIAVQLLYKSLNYQDKNFNLLDGSVITRSENANVLGLDVLAGQHLISTQSEINFEVFYGIGFRHRIRDYTTLNSFTGPGAMPIPLGSFTLSQNYPMLLIGVKIGFNSFSRRESYYIEKRRKKLNGK